MSRKTVLVAILSLLFLSSSWQLVNVLGSPAFRNSFHGIVWGKRAATMGLSRSQSPNTEPQVVSSKTLIEEKTGLQTKAANTADQPAGLPQPDFTRSIAPAAGKLTSGFGQGYSRTFADYRFHNGIDIEAPAGAAVRAVLDGSVVDVNPDPQSGTVIRVEHGGGWQTLYFGCQNVLVKPGSRVRAGEAMAEVGEPGLSEVGEGPHLHLEVRKGTETLNPLQLGIRLDK